MVHRFKSHRFVKFLNLFLGSCVSIKTLSLSNTSILRVSERDSLSLYSVIFTDIGCLFYSKYVTRCVLFSRKKIIAGFMLLSTFMQKFNVCLSNKYYVHKIDVDNFVSNLLYFTVGWYRVPYILWGVKIHTSLLQYTYYRNLDKCRLKLPQHLTKCLYNLWETFI